MHIQGTEGKAGATVLLPGQEPGYSDVPHRSPLWAEGRSWQDLSGPAHLQTYCKAALKEWYENLVWKLRVLPPLPVPWHQCAWRLSFQPISHWSVRRHLGDFSHIWQANPNYMPRGTKEKQHLILKENMWLLLFYDFSKNECNAERAAKETDGPHTAGQ